MSTVSKYWEKYKEKKNSESQEKSDLSKLMTDKQSYISYIEVQLEKVAQSLIVTQSFAEKLESFQVQLQSSEEKLSSISKLMKLQQTYIDKQDEELSSFKNSVESLVESKISQALTDLHSTERRVKVLEDKSEYPIKHETCLKEIESAVKLSEAKLALLLTKSSEDLEAKHRKALKTTEGNFDITVNNLSEQVAELEQKILKIQNFSGFEGKKQDEKTSEKNNEKIFSLESSVKDLERFLVAIAEEVKKIDNNQQILSESENRLSSTFNSRLKKLADLVQKKLDFKENFLEFSPQKTAKDFEFKDSPKFPTLESDKKRSKSKETDQGKRSKSPSARNKSKDSIELKSPNSRKSSLKSPQLKEPPSPSRKASPGSSLPKSKVMEACLKEKLKKFKEKPKEEKPKEEKPKTRKKSEKNSKLDKLYQELSKS